MDACRLDIPNPTIFVPRKNFNIVQYRWVIWPTIKTFKSFYSGMLRPIHVLESLSFDDVLLKPRYSTIKSRSEVDLSTQLTKNISLKIPIISASMDTVTDFKMAEAMGKLGGIGIIHRFMTIEEQVYHVKQCDISFGGEDFKVGAAVGIKDWDKRTGELIKAGADVIVLDVAHGDSLLAIEAIKGIKSKYSVDLIAGNVATGGGAYRLQQAGADAIKVGIGSGSVCSTRIVTGIGVPQLSAIQDCASWATVPIIADGGIKNSGDIVKALAAGASAVMLGNLLAGTDESPSHRDGAVKEIRGMASEGAIRKKKELDGDSSDVFFVEGVEGFVPYVGSVETQITKLINGVRSGMSYLNSRTIQEISSNAEFIRITQNGLIESHPHDVLKER